MQLRTRISLNVIVISIFFFFHGMTVSGQNDRINSGIPFIGDKVLWSLDQAIGWTKNKEGQWIEGKNKIQFASASLANKAAWSEGTYATGKDNFLKYEAREIKIGGTDFLLLTKIMQEGITSYSGVSLEKRVYYIVIKKNSAKQKPNSFDATAIDYISQCHFLGFVPYAADYLAAIALQIGKDDQTEPRFKTQGTTITLEVPYKEPADNKSCRFHIYAGGISTGSMDMLPKDSMERLVYLFTEYYFECPKERLEGLLKLITP